MKVKTYKKVVPVRVVTTTNFSFYILECRDWADVFYDLPGVTAVPYLANPEWTSDNKYKLLGQPRNLCVNRDCYETSEEYVGDPVLVWDGNYIEVPEDVYSNNPLDYFFADETDDEFAFPVTQEEFDRIFDTYYDDKENE